MRYVIIKYDETQATEYSDQGLDLYDYLVNEFNDAGIEAELNAYGTFKDALKGLVERYGDSD